MVCRILIIFSICTNVISSLTRRPDAADDETDRNEPGVPFAREWPLLALKFALWWAGQQNLGGVAWSTPALHLDRWQGYDPPTEVYRRGLPDSASRLARVLPLVLSRTMLLRRRVRQDDRPGCGWLVLSAAGQPLCRSFHARDQADRFADMTGAADQLAAPVLWLPPSQRYEHMPLFGVGQAAMWAAPIDRPDAANGGACTS